jgi:iron complex transport system ATP-binding protein
VIIDIDVAFMPGEVTAVIGPNGAGKSSLLRALFGEHRPGRGQVLLDEDLLQPDRRRAWQSRIGYMPQDNRARRGLTALETVLLGSIERLSLRISDAALREATFALEKLGLVELAHRSIETLSGGERQLVFFAQVLLRRPRVLLLDEPVSALDLRHQVLLLERVQEVTREQELITVVVLHDLNLAARFSDRLVVLHSGRVAANGVPREVLSTRLLSQVYGVEARINHDIDGRTWIQVLGADSAS